MAAGGAGGYLFLKNERQEVEQAKAQQEFEQNKPINKIKTELAKNKWTSGAIKVDFNEATGALTITDDTEPSGGLDQPSGLGQETSSSALPEEVLQQTYNMYVRAGQAAFSVDSVKSLTVIRIIPVNRGTGIVSQTEVALIKASKDSFLAVDWESLEGKPIHSAIDESADVLSLDPGFVRSIRNANLLILLPAF